MTQSPVQLALREFKPEDLEFVLQTRGDEETMEFLQPGSSYSSKNKNTHTYNT